MNKNRKMVIVFLFASVLCFSLAGCTLQDRIEEYSSGKEQCYLNTENVTRFSYKGNDYTILADTLVATVLVLPGAKIAVSYFILLPHKVCDKELYTSVEAAKGELSALYDVIVSNNKKPIGVCAMVISDNTIIALSHDKAPDKALFETSLKEFLKNDKLNVTVTLYTEKDTFIKRAANMAANYDNSDTNKNNRIKYVTESCLNMCL